MMIRQAFAVGQAAIALGNTYREIAGLKVSDSPTQAEVQALGDKAQEPVDDVRALSGLVYALRGRSSRWRWHESGTSSQRPVR